METTTVSPKIELEIKEALTNGTLLDLPSQRKGFPPIILDSEYFMITQEDYDSLRVYDTSIPTGVYHGKVWRSRSMVVCFLQDGHPEGLATPRRYPVII